jgi:hypothetical protein
MGPDIAEYDFVIWSNLGQANKPLSLQDNPGKSKVLIYVSDETSSIPLELGRHCVAIFKAYLPQEFPEQRLYALPLGYVRGVPAYDSIPLIQRRTNVFFSGTIHRSRASFGQTLVYLAGKSKHRTELKNPDLTPTPSRDSGILYDWSCAFPDSYICITTGFSKGLNRTSYGAKLCDSKIALCPGGWQSSETFRHYEAMRAGCIVISDRLPDTRLYRNSPIIQLADWTYLDRTIENLLGDTARMVALQGDTLNWWKTVCSESAVAAFIHEQLRNE